MKKNTLWNKQPQNKLKIDRPLPRPSRIPSAQVKSTPKENINIQGRNHLHVGSYPPIHPRPSSL